MAELKLDGLGVALVTPFHDDLTIDYDSLESLLEYVLSGGCDYLVVLGTTGETPTLNNEEKKEITKFVKEKVNGRKPLILGIGGNSTSAVMHDIAVRDLSGYSAILSVTPYYNKPSQEGLFQHYKAISETSPLPIILYNVPGRTGVNLTSETTLRLAHLSNKIIAIKEASGKVEQCIEIINRCPEYFKVISGDDATTTILMEKGAKGVISVMANAYPSIVKKLVDLCSVGKFSEAEDLQKSLQPLIKHLFEDGNPAGVKSLLSRMGLIKNILRLPLVPVSSLVEENIWKATSALISE